MGLSSGSQNIHSGCWKSIQTKIKIKINQFLKIGENDNEENKWFKKKSFNI